MRFDPGISCAMRMQWTMGVGGQHAEHTMVYYFNEVDFAAAHPLDLSSDLWIGSSGALAVPCHSGPSPHESMLMDGSHKLIHTIIITLDGASKAGSVRRCLRRPYSTMRWKLQKGCSAPYSLTSALLHCVMVSLALGGEP